MRGGFGPAAGFDTQSWLDRREIGLGVGQVWAGLPPKHAGTSRILGRCGPQHDDFGGAALTCAYVHIRTYLLIYTQKRAYADSRACVSGRCRDSHFAKVRDTGNIHGGGLGRHGQLMHGSMARGRRQLVSIVVLVWPVPCFSCLTVGRSQAHTPLQGSFVGGRRRRRRVGPGHRMRGGSGAIWRTGLRVIVGVGSSTCHVAMRLRVSPPKRLSCCVAARWRSEGHIVPEEVRQIPIAFRRGRKPIERSHGTELDKFDSVSRWSWASSCPMPSQA